jgi:hypothetical protein
VVFWSILLGGEQMAGVAESFARGTETAIATCFAVWIQSGGTRCGEGERERERERERDGEVDMWQARSARLKLKSAERERCEVILR